MATKMRILVGYDGSACSDAAIDDLRRAGLPPEIEARVLTVVDAWPHLPASAFEALDEVALANAAPAVRKAHRLAAQALTEAKATAAQGAERLHIAFPMWTIAHGACADSPYRAIVLRADHWRPDLIVVGSHGRSAAGRALLGSVAQKVVNHAICSVRVARLRAESTQLADDPVRLVLGVDGSSDSAAAVSAVAGRAWPAGSEVHVIYAVNLQILTAPLWYNGPIIGWAEAETFADEHKWARKAAEGAAKELSRAGLRSTALVIDGDPKHVLVSEAERLGADCIFVGAKGHSRLDRFLLGSVSAAVIARAHCSVEVVRHG